MKLFLCKDCLGFVVQAWSGTTVWDTSPYVVPDTKLLIKHLKLVWLGAPYMKYRLVVH